MKFFSTHVIVTDLYCPMYRLNLSPRMLTSIQWTVLASLAVLASLGHAAPEGVGVELRPEQSQPLQKKINFVFKHRQRTPNPPGWEEYDGSVYTPERGYGWLTDRAHEGGDAGGRETIVLPDGTTTTPLAIGRPELANWLGAHRENQPIVFRIDLPNGWYRVTCSSVSDHERPLPLVNQRSIKFRAHDTVFAGPIAGAPSKVEGNRLVEGSGIVEVTEGHLRIVVGDPAYGGWIWSYNGPFWRGWRWWWKHPSIFANGWYQKLTRTVDPGFHSLRFNALEIEWVPPPAQRPVLLFRDFFNRDDNLDINAGLTETAQWMRTKLHPVHPDTIRSKLHNTALSLAVPQKGQAIVGFMQRQPSPQGGLIRYSTRLSLYTGEGSRIHSGIQEAGLLILAESAGAHEWNSTFIGVAYDSSHKESSGWVKYRVGNGRDGYRTNAAIPDAVLPFKIAAGEYEIIVEHDPVTNLLHRIQINDVEITGYLAPEDRQQRIPSGLFGIRALMDSYGSEVNLQQFYWYYRVEHQP
jgi:hypothetical protein